MKKFKFIINGGSYEVSVAETGLNVAEIEVNGTPFTVEIQKPDSDSPLKVKPAGKVDTIKVPERTVFATAIKSPLPGSISKILVKEGQQVKRGDLLLTMESMKMENNILAADDGIVNSIRVQAGQTVMQDEILIDFEGQVIVSDDSAAITPVVTEPIKATAPVPVAAAAAPSPSKGSLKSPLPGTVLKVLVKAGDAVKRGSILLTLESMKMENNIMAEHDAVVKAVHVKEGQSIMQGDSLLDLE